MLLPADSADRIAAAVEAAERHTAAELVVVGAPFSGSYRDVDFAVGGGCALAFLGWALFAETAVPELAVLTSVALCAAAGALGSRFSPQLRRALTTGARRRRQAERAARLAFLDQGIDGTRGRTGVLVHVSFLERRVTLVADRGVRACFSADELEAKRQRLDAALRQADPVSALCAAIEQLGAMLGERLPRAEDDEDELRNAPLLGVPG